MMNTPVQQGPNFLSNGHPLRFSATLASVANRMYGHMVGGFLMLQVHVIFFFQQFVNCFNINVFQVF